MTNPPPPPVDLSNCDREPIHVLGGIQPFGFLVALTPDWFVARASENLAQFIGVAAADALGHPLREIFSDDAVHGLRNMVTMLRGQDAVERGFGLVLQAGGPAFDVAVHFSGSLLVIEAEPALSAVGNASSLVRTMASRVKQAQTMPQFLQEAARQVRAATGFDRVMVYRFDQTGAGEVVAEARKPGVDSFLGLHYPASDIPAQARALYVRNVFRIIADTRAAAVPIVPQLDGQGAPLDLSLSVLRAVSPIHIEYLRNMGVDASLSISIVVEGRLWGLFACHNYSVRLPSFVERTAAELFGSMFSLMLEGRERAAAADYESMARSISDRLMAAVAADGSRLADPEWLANIVADAIPADGVGAFVDGDLSLSGLTPDESQFRGIISILNRNAAGQVFTTDCIAGLIPEAFRYASRAAGLLAIPISRTPRDYVVLFRSERIRSVRWAGNPEKPVEYGPNGARLTPRKSFEEWSELVKGTAKPFSPSEMRVAETLRGTLLEILLRLSDVAEAERRRADEHQSLLIAELNHRIRNILALIRGLVAQTERRDSHAREVLSTLDDRILALARAHDQITKDQWGPASLRSLIDTEIGAFVNSKRQQVFLSGSDVSLDPQAFTIMALVIHELVTNAAKYGALSDNGHVIIEWTINGDGSLSLKWTERGGPAVTPPTRRGFGSTIIDRSIPHDLGGTATTKYAPTGLEAEFAIPARFVTETKSSTKSLKARPEGGGTKRPLAGQVVLLLEDNLLVALEAEDALTDLGASEVHVASSVASARELIADHRIDFALLDLNLGQETSLPIADLLAARGIRFIFATGYGEAAVREGPHGEAVSVSKPYTLVDLRRAIILARGGKTG